MTVEVDGTVLENPRTIEVDFGDRVTVQFTAAARETRNTMENSDGFVVVPDYAWTGRTGPGWEVVRIVTSIEPV